MTEIAAHPVEEPVGLRVLRAFRLPFLVQQAPNNSEKRNKKTARMNLVYVDFCAYVCFLVSVGLDRQTTAHAHKPGLKLMSECMIAAFSISPRDFVLLPSIFESSGSLSLLLILQNEIVPCHNEMWPCPCSIRGVAWPCRSASVCCNGDKWYFGGHQHRFLR